jgi:NitT/TauT family transport system substrate-binding protein
MGPGAAIVARTKGAPIKAVYLNMRRNFQFPVVLESSPIKTITDFKGKTIGVISYGAQLVEIIKGMIAEAGLDPEQGRHLRRDRRRRAGDRGAEERPGRHLGHLGLADRHRREHGIKLRKFTTTQAEKLTFGGSYFVRDDYVTKQPQVIEKVLRCVAEGSAMMIANPEGAVRAHWKVYPRPSRPTSTTRRGLRPGAAPGRRRATSSSSPSRERSGASCRRPPSRPWSTSCAPTSASKASSIRRTSTPTSSSRP